LFFFIEHNNNTNIFAFFVRVSHQTKKMSTFTTPTPITRADSLCVDENERFSISPVLRDHLKQTKTDAGMLCPRCEGWMLNCKQRNACKHIFCGICHAVSLLSCVVCDDSKNDNKDKETETDTIITQKLSERMMTIALGHILSQRPLNKRATIYDRFRFIQRLFDAAATSSNNNALETAYSKCYGDNKQLDHLMSDIQEFQADPTTIPNESKLYICLPEKLRPAFDSHATTVHSLTVLRSTVKQQTSQLWQKLTVVTRSIVTLTTTTTVVK
jgi:hypothetical protein